MVMAVDTTTAVIIPTASQGPLSPMSTNVRPCVPRTSPSKQRPQQLKQQQAFRPVAAARDVASRHRGNRRHRRQSSMVVGTSMLDAVHLSQLHGV